MTENRPQKWQVLSSEYLSRKPWFTVRRESLELPNGNRIPDYYVLEYPDWVNVIAVTKAGKLLFVRQYRHGLGEVGVELCAGVREKSDPSPDVHPRFWKYSEHLRKDYAPTQYGKAFLYDAAVQESSGDSHF